MKNILTSSRIRGYKYQPEIIEAEISDWKSRHTSPRHMSAPETISHRGMIKIGNVNYAPRMCQIDAKDENQAKIAANIALNVLKYKLGDRTSQRKHLENVCSNLEHRLQVAKSQKDNQLISILKDEYKQLVCLRSFK